MPDEQRALMTDREREIIRGEADVSDSYRYQTRYRIRQRIRRLREDYDLLKEFAPEIAEDLEDELTAVSSDDLEQIFDELEEIRELLEEDRE